MGGFALVMLACAVLFLDGCAPQPPRTIAVSPSLPDGVHEAAQRAASAWCDVSNQTHWCPDIVDSDGDSEVRPDDWPGACESDSAPDEPCNGMHNYRGIYIGVSPMVRDWDADKLTIQLTHEFGHYGIDGHVKRSLLMRAVNPASAAVDSPALAAWCEQQGC